MNLSPRLKMIYDLLPDNRIMIDVGTDHCYLPVYALRQGKIKRAYAADVRPGPLQNAEKTAKTYGCADKITMILSDGLDALSRSQSRDIDTVVMAGMGGILISELIEKAPFLKNPDKTLILQPMTAVFELKEYLGCHGFAILDERLAEEGEKLYIALKVVYNGKAHTENPFRRITADPLFEKYAKLIRARLIKQKKGLESAAAPDEKRYREVLQKLNDLEEVYHDC